ncbi:MAG: restriction endonuclease subunit S [Sulfurovum sp.]|nr:restriction endonuclease subunit S [Sulfurovum sp.]
MPFLKVLNLNEFEIKTKKLDFISFETHEEMKRSQLHGDEILYTMAGTIGIAFDYNKKFEQANINQAIAKIKLFEPSLNKIIVYLLNSKICQLQAKRFLTVSAQPNINFEQIKSIKIPLPPLKIQNTIIQIMDNAYKVKKENEQKAKELLNSIDIYLLDKLDITLPKEEKVVSFKVSSSDILGSRFDPNYHKVYYKELEDSLNSGKYGIIKLGNIANDIASGSTPKSGGNDYLSNGNIYFLRLVNLDNDLTINTTKALFIKEKIHNGMLKRSQLKKGDLLFGIAGSIGKMAIVDLDIQANINQAIALIRFKDIVNNLFIAFILDSIFTKLQIKHLQRPVAQPNLNTTELKSIKIPLPPLDIQNEIASHIQSLRDEAKFLQKEAKEVLKFAKNEVESIILGKV